MSRPLLDRFATRVLRDNSAVDKAQVPAAGAQIDFYCQGATVSQPVTLYPNSPTFDDVQVYNSGGFTTDMADPDDVQVGVGTPFGKAYADSPTLLKVKNTSQSVIVLFPGSRLVLSSNRPSVYADPTGQVEVMGSDFVTTDGDGRVGAYVRQRRFDRIVSHPAFTSRLHDDEEGGLVPSPTWVDVQDYGGDIQSALDALPDEGGTVYLPTKTWPTATTIKISKPVRLIGDGPERSIIERESSANGSNDVLSIESDDVSIEGIQVAMSGNNGTPGRGIVIGTAIGPTIRSISIIDVRIFKLPNWGIYIEDGIADVPAVQAGWFERVDIRDSLSSSADGTGIYVGRFNRQHWFRGCNVTGFRGYGIRLVNARDIALVETTVEFDLGNTKPYVSLVGCRGVRLVHCWFEDPTDRESTQYFIALSDEPSSNVVCRACRFVRQSTAPSPPINLMVARTQNRDVALVNPEVKVSSDDAADPREDVLVEDDSEVTVVGNTILRPSGPEPLVVTDGKTPQLGLPFRLRVPRMDAATRDQAVQDLEPGDVIFETDSASPQVYDGSAWKSLWSKLWTIDYDQEQIPHSGTLVPSVSEAGVGVYTVSVYGKTQVVDTGSVVVKVTWNDGVGVKTETLITLDLASLGTQENKEIDVYVGQDVVANQAIQYAIEVDSLGTGAYMVRLRAQRA